MLYFKYLFLHAEDLTPNEGIVYSELVFNSLVSNSDYKTGELLYIDNAKRLMENYRGLQWEETIVYYPLSVRELMHRTEMTFPTIKKIMGSLEEKRYIEGGEIKCSLGLLQEGYMKMPRGLKLKGRQLIFYSFLLERSKRYGGTLDTWVYRFKELCGVDSDDAYFMIKKLKKRGLVERLDGGELKINQPPREKKRKKPSQPLP